MHRRMLATLILIWFAACTSTFDRTAQAIPSIEGIWVGGWDMNGRYTPVQVRFDGQGVALKGTIDIPVFNERNLGLKEVKSESSTLRFALSRSNGGPLMFEGHFSDAAIIGKVQQGELSGTFHLVRGAAVYPKDVDEYVGSYQLKSDKYIWITSYEYSYVPARSNPWRVLMFSENESHRYGVLFASSATEFFAGPGRFVPYPVETRITFLRDKKGRLTGLKWKPPGIAERVAKKVNLFREEEIRIPNGDVTLACTLTLPASPKPHPGAVLINGSDVHTRVSSGAITGLVHRFAMHGIASVACDKRGNGGSTGNLQTATFDDLASDAGAAVQYLQKRSDIRTRQVGLWGISQGGWIAPLVANRAPNVAFVILHSGPAVSPRIQGLQEMEIRMRQRGFSADEIRQASEYLFLYHDAMLSDAAYDKLQAAYEAATKQGARWVWNPGPKERLQHQWVRLTLDFDPLPVLEKVQCPVLAFFGETDVLVPPSGNVKLMEEALRRGGNNDVTIKILANANHRLEEDPVGTKTHAAAGKTITGYYETMFDWLKKRIESH